MCGETNSSIFSVNRPTPSKYNVNVMLTDLLPYWWTWLGFCINLMRLWPGLFSFLYVPALLLLCFYAPFFARFSKMKPASGYSQLGSASLMLGHVVVSFSLRDRLIRGFINPSINSQLHPSLLHVSLIDCTAAAGRPEWPSGHREMSRCSRWPVRPCLSVFHAAYST